jgi:transposase
MARKRKTTVAEPKRERPGQPTKLTPGVQERIVEALRTGSYKTTAAAYAGIDVRSIYHWLERGEADIELGIESDYAQFFQAVKKAEADHEINALLLIDNAARTGDGAWQAAAWTLARKHPDRWGRRQRVDGLTPDEFDEHLSRMEDELEDLEGGLNRPE